MRATGLWLLLLALASVAIAGAQASTKEDANLEAIVTSEQEPSEVDTKATEALPERYRSKGWRIHKNKRCSYNYYRAKHCPKEYDEYKPYDKYSRKDKYGYETENPESYEGKHDKEDYEKPKEYTYPYPSPRSPSPSPAPVSSPSPAPLPSPSPAPAPSPSPAPLTEYCCGSQGCRFPVPVPPVDLPTNNCRRPQKVDFAPSAEFETPLPRVAAPVDVLAACEGDARRVELPDLGGNNQATVLMNMEIIQNPDSQDPACPGVGVSSCTGNLISRSLVLTAAHCVFAKPGCKLASVKVCNNYNPGNTDPNFNCPAGSTNTRAVLGVSISPDWKKVEDPNDIAILFLADPMEVPTYFEYNYIENFSAEGTQTATGSWVNRAYTGGGRGNPERCGCLTCPSIPCNLAQAGPVRNEVNYSNKFFLTPGLEICGGSSGSCLNLNGAMCCVGTLSFEGTDGPVCGTDRCNTNTWSAMTSTFPLTNLWSSIQQCLAGTT